MPTDTITIQPKTRTGTQIIWAGNGSTLITNLDLVDTIYLGDNDAIKAGDPSGVVPLGPNGSVVVDGKSDLFAVNGNTTPVTVATLNGGVANFLGLTQGGGTLAIPSIQSPNFINNVSGWQVTQAGNAQFNNLILRGTFLGLDFIINSLGIFIYSGTPALGNLVGSWAPAAGPNDGLGNAFFKDLAVYAAINTGYSNLSSVGGVAGNTALLFNPGSTSHVTVKPQVYGGSQNSGLANEIEDLVITSGKAGSNGDAAIQLFSAAADLSSTGHTDFYINGTLISQAFLNQWDIGVPISCTLGTPSSPTVITTDTPHQAALINGWTNSGANANGLWYQLNPNNTVTLTFDVIPPVGVVGNSTCFVLPAGYRPATSKNLGVIGWNNPQVNNSASLPWVFVASNGSVSIIGIEVANIPMFGTFTLPLW